MFPLDCLAECLLASFLVCLLFGVLLVGLSCLLACLPVCGNICQRLPLLSLSAWVARPTGAKYQDTPKAQALISAAMQMVARQWHTPACVGSSSLFQRLDLRAPERRSSSQQTAAALGPKSCPGSGEQIFCRRCGCVWLSARLARSVVGGARPSRVSAQWLEPLHRIREGHEVAGWMWLGILARSANRGQARSPGSPRPPGTLLGVLPVLMCVVIARRAGRASG